MNNTSKILTAFAAGAALATGLTLLFAPKSGAETRKNIRNQGKKLVDAVQNKYKGVNEKITDVKTGIRQSLDQLKDKVMA